MLGDKKDFSAQARLFSENTVLNTFTEGIAILKLNGRKEMAEAFGKFLKGFETVYHFNGQQIVNLDGDKATGTCYCLITLIATEDGRKIKTTIAATYHDDYIRDNNRWLISKRIGDFEWQEKTKLN